ncbi:Ig-like domain-containing protein [Archangium sp.]|jgi:hypothetical protein|uniref:Ig-like domain-containing protein n=1 Tax=Archangium sp. TaxID=1872627 RepID=UPI002EDA4932
MTMRRWLKGGLVALALCSARVGAFAVDTSSPPVLEMPVAGALLTTRTPLFSGRADAGALVVLMLDGGELDRARADTAGRWSIPAPRLLAEGPHQVKAGRVDALGGVGSFSESRAFTVDTVPPAVPELRAPTPGALLNTLTLTLSGRAEPASRVTVYLLGSVPLGTATADAAGTWSLSAGGVPEGYNEVRARAVDAAGNASPATPALGFTVDTTPPNAPEVLSAEEGTGAVGTSFPVITGTAEPDSVLALYVGVVRLGTTRADATGRWSFISPLPLAEGDYVVRASATDAAGHTSPESSPYLFSLGKLPPDTAITSGPEGTLSSTEATFEFASPRTSATFECALDVAAYEPCTSPVTFRGLASGAHTLKVRAKDALGRTDPTPASRTWTIAIVEDLTGNGVGCNCSASGVSPVLASLSLVGLALHASRRRGGWGRLPRFTSPAIRRSSLNLPTGGSHVV